MPPLKHHPDQPPPVEEPVSVEYGDLPALVLFFVMRDGRQHGYLYAHLISCVFEKNNAEEDGGLAAPDLMTIAFPQANAVLLGSRLHKVRHLLSSGRIIAFIELKPRYSKVETQQPIVSRITITERSR